MFNWRLGIDPNRYGSGSQNFMSFQDIRRECESSIIRPIPRNEDSTEESKEESKKSLLQTLQEAQEVTPLSRLEYQLIVKEERKKIVHKHFGDELKIVFSELKEKAKEMKRCQFQVSFDIPEHFNVDTIEELLRDYFLDEGYETVADPREEDSRKIVLMLS